VCDGFWTVTTRATLAAGPPRGLEHELQVGHGLGEEFELVLGGLRAVDGRGDDRGLLESEDLTDAAHVASVRW